MFYINFSTLWSLTFFFFSFYSLIIFSFIIYLIPVFKDLTNLYSFKKYINFEYLTGYDLYWIFYTYVLTLLTVNFSWSSPLVLSWFGNMIFSQFQEKFLYLIFFTSFASISVFCSSFFFGNKGVYDFMIIILSFFFWIMLLFLSNNFFSFIFLIEILSTLITLLLVTSTFSSTYFYNNLDLSLSCYFNNSTPLFYVQMLMYFFWISLITSLNLFFFLVLFYVKFLTTDWFFLDFIFYYIISLSTNKDLFLIFFIWLNLMFSIFLKCGLVPFYFWKPVFFKGIPLHALFFYVFFFYFFLLLFVVFFFISYVSEVFLFFSLVNIFLLSIGFVIMFFILCEAYYIKSFFALSSILNTLFIFLAMNGLNSQTLMFFL